LIGGGSSRGMEIRVQGAVFGGARKKCGVSKFRTGTKDTNRKFASGGEVGRATI